MIADLKPYPEYKESGQEWLGNVPKHWDLKPGHAAFDKRKISNAGLKENTVLSLSYGRIKIKPTDKQHGLVPESYETYQIVDEGNIIIRGTDLQNDHTSLRIGLVRNRGIISSAYLCLQCRDTVTPEYGYQILNTFDLTKAIYRYGSGLRQNLDHGEIKRLPIFLPPVSEQAAIVRFLNHWNGRLDKAIRAKRRVIALLQEQKQAIIHRAVTRGLDPNVKLKDSGIPWLGETPEHWEMRNLRQLLKERTKRGRPDLPLLSVVREKGIIIRDTENAESNHNFIPDDLTNYKVVERGQFAMNKMKAWQGSYGVSKHSGIVSPAYFVFDLRGVEGAFFHVALRSKAYVPFFTQASDGVRVGQWDLNQSRMREIPFYYPAPSEQLKIVKYVEESTANLTTAIARYEREITLLREYRTRLTADVVTGKLDVRAAAAQLPEHGQDPAEAEPLEEEAELEEVDG